MTCYCKKLISYSTNTYFVLRNVVLFLKKFVYQKYKTAFRPFLKQNNWYKHQQLYYYLQTYLKEKIEH